MKLLDENQALSGSFSRRRRQQPYRRRRILSMITFGFLFPAGVSYAQPQPIHAQLFPANDEYDDTILDPHTMYGSPFGGFSRATASRLASLPLKLPDEVVADTTTTNQDTNYYEIADYLGRRYVCRVFDETELDDGSLKESLFDPPTFRLTVEVEGDNNLSSQYYQDVRARIERSMGHHPEVAEEFLGEPDPLPPPTGFKAPIPLQSPKTFSEAVQDDFNLDEVDNRLDVLEGLCVQRRVHPYWNYEWCYEGTIHRFHLKTDNKSEDAKNSPKIRIQDVTTLGHYKDKKIEIRDMEDEDPYDEARLDDDDRNVEDFPLAIVHEKFTNGDRCNPDTRKAKTTVHLRCCSEETTFQHESAWFLFGVPHDIPLASIVSVWEDPEKDCRFHMEVCTPILCEETDVYDLWDRIELAGLIGGDEDTAQVHVKQQQQQPAKKMELLSIPEILEETFGENRCLHSKKDGWWKYEYCHKKHVRQYSGEQPPKDIRRNDPNDETQYLLGFYNPEKNEPLDERRHLVNGTNLLAYGGYGEATRKRGGNRAYLELEYDLGDECILSDDVANADEVSAASIARTCSVRISCDSDFFVTVREDSTCHYVVEVTVPTLCEHGLFKPAVTKKRVVKCLPIDGQPCQM